MRKIILIALFLLSVAPVTYAAADIYVDPTAGADIAAGSQAAPYRTIQKAVDTAQPGDSIHLADGIYLQDVITRRSGDSTNPITISGSRGATLIGGGGSRIVEINHDYITLSGFTIDGHWGADSDTQSSYRDKTLYIIGKDPQEGVTGVKIMNMAIKNAGGECIRLRYFSHDNEIAGNTIGPCGIVDFVFSGGGKNGEGIYVGTAPEQRGMNGAPTADPDVTQHNWIHDNTINTQGNECVDIKEDSTANIVENNQCTGQKDPDSGGLDARGNANIFRHNTVTASVGVGVRLGGDTPLYGVDNDVYENTLTNNAVGGIKFMRSPQRNICGNTMSGNTGGDSVGDFKTQFNPTTPCTNITPTVTASPTPVITAGACRLGDTNGDGKITLADYEAWRRVYSTAP